MEKEEKLSMSLENDLFSKEKLIILMKKWVQIL